jgi:hypothetical protein
METAPGLMRGVMRAVHAGADIINLSYGEPTSRSDVGAICRKFSFFIVLVRGVELYARLQCGQGGPCMN